MKLTSLFLGLQYQKNGVVEVFNLNTGEGVSVFSDEGELIETNMSDIEIMLAGKYFVAAKKYIEN